MQAAANDRMAEASFVAAAAKVQYIVRSLLVEALGHYYYEYYALPYARNFVGSHPYIS